jgi:hypothetical protein
MSQMPLTLPEQFAALGRYGYEGEQAEFACLAALHGGHFVPRQYVQFLRRSEAVDYATATQRLRQFLDRLFDDGHGTALVFGAGEPVYRMSGRSLYKAIGQENNRNRRERQPSTIKQKLMGFDYVLAHPAMRFLATEQEKLAYFCDACKVASDVLPGKTYAAAMANPTRRYFVEKYPIGILEESGRTSAHFCFVDEGLTTGSHFETFLRQYLALFDALSGVRVVYVAANPAAFRMAQKVFAAQLRKAGSPVEIDNRLLRYFEIRRCFESKEVSLDRTALLELRDAKQRFSGAESEQQFVDWRSRQNAPGVFQKHTTLRLETYLLEHRYDIFGTLTA